MICHIEDINSAIAVQKYALTKNSDSLRNGSVWSAGYRELLRVYEVYPGLLGEKRLDVLINEKNARGIED